MANESSSRQGDVITGGFRRGPNRLVFQRSILAKKVWIHRLFPLMLQGFADRGRGRGIALRGKDCQGQRFCISAGISTFYFIFAQNTYTRRRLVSTLNPTGAQIVSTRTGPFDLRTLLRRSAP